MGGLSSDEGGVDTSIMLTGGVERAPRYVRSSTVVGVIEEGELVVALDMVGGMLCLEGIVMFRTNNDR